MNLQHQYDDAMFDFSRGDFASAIARLRELLTADAAHFDAQLSLGMALYRQGDYAGAIVEGHKAVNNHNTTTATMSFFIIGFIILRSSLFE